MTRECIQDCHRLLSHTDKEAWTHESDHTLPVKRWARSRVFMVNKKLTFDSTGNKYALDPVQNAEAKEQPTANVEMARKE